MRYLQYVGLTLMLGGTALLGGCGMSAEEEKVAAHLEEALDERGLKYWDVKKVDIESEDSREQGLVTLYDYKVDATLELDKALQSLRYIDKDRRIVVTQSSIKEGKTVSVPALVQVTRLNEEEEAVVELSLEELPKGITEGGFKQKYKGWDVVEVGSDEYKALVKELSDERDQVQKNLALVAERLAGSEVRLRAAQAEYTVLEKNAEDIGGLADAMDQAEQKVKALDEQTAALREQRDTLKEKLALVSDDLKKLKG